MSNDPYTTRPRPRPEDFAEFNAGTRRARRAYQGHPCPDCGRMCQNEQGLALHRHKHCSKRLP